MIDEVDVFFSKDFYNQAYIPIAEIKDPSISDFLDYLWTNKDNKMVTNFYNLTKS